MADLQVQYKIAELISGTKIAASVTDELKVRVAALLETHGCVPGIIYVNNSF